MTSRLCWLNTTTMPPFTSISQITFLYNKYSILPILHSVFIFIFFIYSHSSIFPSFSLIHSSLQTFRDPFHSHPTTALYFILNDKLVFILSVSVLVCVHVCLYIRVCLYVCFYACISLCMYFIKQEKFKNIYVSYFKTLLKRNDDSRHWPSWQLR